LIEQNRQLQDEVAKWRAYYASQLSNATPQNVSQTQIQVSNPTAQNNSAPTGNATAAHPATNANPKTHTVASGETAAAISRKFNVKLSALQSANSNANLSKLRVGQVLNLP